MKIIERVYQIKKRIIGAYNAYFTINGTYTSILPDKLYLKLKYRNRVGKELILKNPQMYTEKLNWLKLYDRRPEYTQYVDKYAVRDYVAKKIGADYLVPLLGVWDSPEDISIATFPDQFVLKCNHDNGVVICKDKNIFNFEVAKYELKLHFRRDYYKKEREWPYKNVKRKIIAEAFLSEEGSESLTDYKFFCFDGKVKALFIATDRSTETKFDFYNRDFQHLEIMNGHPQSGNKRKEPENYDEMVRIAEKLSEGLPHVRVDLYNINGKIYFGELTLHHYGGFHPLEPEQWEYIFGDWLVLPRKKPFWVRKKNSN